MRKHPRRRALDAADRATGPTAALSTVAVALGVAIAGTFGGPPEDARAAFPGSNGDIAFEAQGSSGEGSGLDVFVTDATGRAPQNLTSGEPAASEERLPAFSADGRRIAYVSDRDHLSEDPYSRGSDLYVMNADGTGKTRLTADGDASPHGRPGWSPDGRRIFFTGRDGGLYSAGADGTGRTRLSTTVSSWGDVDVSPDGRLVLFVGDAGSGTGNDQTVYIARTDGSGQRQLTPGAGEEGAARFLPDGRVVFHRDLTFGSAGADPARYVVGQDGTGERRLSAGYSAVSPSPDGTQAVFKGPDGLYVSALDGAEDGARKIVSEPQGSGPLAFANGPDWAASSAAPAPTPDPAPAPAPPNTTPTVTSIRPTPGSSTGDRTPPIAATVRDGQENLAKSRIRVLVDGRARSFAYNTATDRAALSPALPKGAHTVRIEARDSQGLLGVRSWRFTVR